MFVRFVRRQASAAAGLNSTLPQPRPERTTAISIRRATPDDAATVHALIRALAEHQDQASAITVSVTDLERMLTHPDITYLIAERGGQVIGYVSWLERISFWSGEDYLALDDLYVTGAERGHGVGEQLMRLPKPRRAG